jgi:signal transduction histidine kinase
MLTVVEPAAPPRGTWAVIWRVLLALLLGLVVWAPNYLPVQESGSSLQHAWWWVIDPLLGVAAIAGVLALVRRRPVPVAVGSALVAVVSGLAFGAALLALCSVATRRRWPEIAVVAAVDLGAFMIVNPIYERSGTTEPWWLQLAILSIGIAMVVAVGVAVGQRRALLAGLRERAETAEREQAARVEATRIAERNRIASDMHDVLAHRISLVAMHAAAVGYRTDLAPEQQRQAIRTIEDNARLALQELRDVLGVLRDPATLGGAPEPPQPRIGDIAALVDEGRAAGMHIELVEDVDVGTAGEPPSLTAQTANRVVREALTNARKHAPDTRVTVSVAGEPGDGLALRITNPAPLRPGGAGLAGAGMGLVGLAERVAQAGGRISHGPRADGGFELAVWLPWDDGRTGDGGPTG